MVDETIVIEEKDLQTEAYKRLKEPATNRGINLDFERRRFIMPGVPVTDPSVPEPEINIPNRPHVLIVDELHVTDKNHRDLVLNEVPVIFAHGRRDDETWKFADGQSVVETVKAWDRHARLNDLPEIEFVIACNEDKQPNPLGIKIKDFQPDKVIAQAVGNKLSMGIGKIDKDNRVILEIIEDAGDEIWGLEELKVLKQIKIE